MTLTQAVFLGCAGAIGGGLNAVAGGGSFIAFPALLFTGISPIPANATNTVAMWTGAAASGGAYRKRIDVPGRVMVPLLITSVAGGLAGAVLLLKTPPHTFMRVLPWLMLGATLLFILGNKLAGSWGSAIGKDASGSAIAAAAVFEFVVAIYGGYFGGGIGIVNLAMLAALGMTDIHSMNALKSALGSVINGVAVVAFILSRSVYWPQAVVMIAGAVAGGYFGAHYAQRLPQAWIRGTVISIGTVMTLYFFARSW